MELEGDDQKASGSGSRGRFKWICVFCGSRSGYKPAFGDAALELGKQLVRRNINLVYGGGSAGLMGLISKTVFDGGCQVTGIIPKAVIPQEISGETIGEVISVADMHERKSEMAKHSDAFIALPGHFDHINCSFPHSCFLLLYLTDFLKTFAITMLSIDPAGGYGTMEELLEMIAWAQLGIHEKPVGLLNVDGYYNSLLALFDKGVEEGFIEKSARQIVVSSDTAEELVRKMEEYSPVHDRVVPRQSWGAVDQLPDPFAHGHASTS